MIPVYKPWLFGNEKKYVNDCLDSSWISSRGDYIEKFENSLAEYLGVKHCSTTSNGSVSLHLILESLEFPEGSEVITSSLTYAATVSSIFWARHIPVLVDSTFDYQPSIISIQNSITENTVAVLLPELYGSSLDIDVLLLLLSKHNIVLIEDSAEVFGTKYKNKCLGSFGKASSFSLFGNKTITTGEGGFIATNDSFLFEKISLLKNQSHIGSFYHSGPGFNYRMTNIQAAIGLAQLENIDIIVSAKKQIAERYRTEIDCFYPVLNPDINSSEWMPLFILPDHISYKDFHFKMTEKGIDTRPCFVPIHLMSGWKYKVYDSLKTSEIIYQYGFNLPSFPSLTKQEVDYIIEMTNKVLNEK